MCNPCEDGSVTALSSESEVRRAFPHPFFRHGLTGLFSQEGYDPRVVFTRSLYSSWRSKDVAGPKITPNFYGWWPFS